MPSVGPELPPHLTKRKREEENERSPQSPKNVDSDGAEKRRRVLGPAMPPAPLAERPPESAEEEESSDDDDFGPALPPAPGSAVRNAILSM